jgi:hypothetical protein
VTAVGGAVGARTEAPPGAVLASGPGGLEVAAGQGSLALRGLADPERPDAPPEGLFAAISAGERLGVAS